MKVSILLMAGAVSLGLYMEAYASCIGGPSASFVQVATGKYHSCGLTSEGVVLCWGWDNYGQLGDGGLAVNSPSPVIVDTTPITGENAFVALTTGDFHSCGLTAEGVAYCWGRDNHGQLGNGGGSTDSQSPVPVDTTAIAADNALISIVAGSMHTCGLTSQGMAYCWGYDGNGQLGDGGGPVDSQTPIAVDTSSITSEKALVLLAAGYGNTCGLTAEGVAYCWGNDSEGELGDGGVAASSQSPVAVDTSPIVGESAFISLSAGDRHACGLTAEGAAYCWGFDASGQLGNGGGSVDSQSPVAVDTSPIVGEKSFAQLEAGVNHTCGLTVEGVGYCWGDDDYGQLGNGSVTSISQSPSPVDTSTVTGEKALILIAGGGYHTCGLTAERVAYCWGDDDYGQLGNGIPAFDSQSPAGVDTASVTGEKALVMLAGGGRHTCGLSAEGVAYCWGDDSQGQLGNGGSSVDSQSPVAVDIGPITGERALVMIAGGQYHTCGLTAEGMAYCWGDDGQGQLGNGGSSVDSQSPVAVDIGPITGERALVMIAGGQYHTCGLTAEGVAYCWGDDSQGQLGNGGSSVDSQSPVAVDIGPITGGRALVMIAGGQYHTCGLTAEGVAYCWGDDGQGQLGNGGSSVDSQSPVAVDIGPIIGEKALVMLTPGWYHTCALTAEGTAYCWGDDSGGKLGDGGGWNDSQDPRPVYTWSIVGEKAFLIITAGGNHTCGLTAEGVAYCWGSDQYGQVGNGGIDESPSAPDEVDISPIAGEKTFVVLSGGGYHTCGITAEGVTYCWGDDSQGQLGNGGSSVNSYSPIVIDTCLPCLTDADCPFCQECDGAGDCVLQLAGSDIKNECASDACLTGNCDGGGACGVLPSGTNCGTCARCDRMGSCVDDLNQDSDCPLCQQCAAGRTCVNQPAGSDIKNECTADACNTGSCSGAGACSVVASGTDCGVCRACNGTGGCVDDLTQDGDCALCKECGTGGACVNQLSGSDIKNECPADACNTGTCNGAGACGFVAASADCGICRTCNGSGSCTDDLTQDADCALCMECSAGGTCVSQALGSDVKNECAADACNTGTCDGLGACEVMAAVTDCGTCRACNATGSCTDDLTQDGDCALCKECGTGGACVNQLSGSDIKNECTADACNTGSCNGAGACGFVPAGTDCGVCRACNGAGGCVDDLSQDADCALCKECAAGGSCVNQALGSDVKNECAADACNTCNGLGACGVMAAGTDCGTCRACNATGSCTDDLTQDGDCALCKECGTGGACVNQLSGSDIKNECTADVCNTGNCNGAGVCGFIDAGTDCGMCRACNATGSCIDDLTQDGDCPLCQECAFGGACTNQAAGQDLKGECADPLYCNGLETCDGSGSCQAGTSPCGTLNCDEANDRCTGCNADADCPFCQWCNGVGNCLLQPAGSDVKDECTANACQTGSCDGQGACEYLGAGTPCPDTDLCSGTETCDGAGECLPGTPIECGDGLFCNGAESCDPLRGCLPGNDPCDDSDSCTQDSCDEENDSCSHMTDQACDQGAADGCGCVSSDGGGRNVMGLILLGLVLWSRRRSLHPRGRARVGLAAPEPAGRRGVGGHHNPVPLSELPPGIIPED